MWQKQIVGSPISKLPKITYKMSSRNELLVNELSLSPPPQKCINDLWLKLKEACILFASPQIKILITIWSFLGLIFRPFLNFFGYELKIWIWNTIRLLGKCLMKIPSRLLLCVGILHDEAFNLFTVEGLYHAK